MDRLFSKSTLMAAIVAIVVVAWMATGSVTAPGTNSQASPSRTVKVEDTAAATGPGERAGLRVGVRRSTARSVDRTVDVSARTEPNRVVEVRGEAEGRVVEINAERGAFVAEGDVLARLDMRDRQARLEEAQAQLDQHRIQYEAAQRLRDQNLSSEVQIAEARARLVSSQAALRNIELEIERTVVRAPFDGVVQERAVEVGDLVRIGDSIVEFVDTDPIIVVGDVNEREIGDLYAGREGSAILAGGTKVDGVVRYVAPVANSGTRTFQVELAVPNPDLRFRAGVTAELELATQSVSGHMLAASLLTLDDEGTIGVKIVDAGSKARFVPVEILRSDTEGVLVAGLADDVDIIAVGQGFVVDGQTVDAVPADNINTAAAP